MFDLLDFMSTKTVCISMEEYEFLKKKAEVDEELLQDIAMGIKYILAGNAVFSHVIGLHFEEFKLGMLFEKLFKNNT